ncbi:hypothetical protein DSO57_1007837 [Entomophthora muscae]|uniref:Uncharacterized protein n=1 Tax=Entomophthora muscae TaxID=34485 RepID=A0ACC2RYD4_9FUNG|nr:hypothetical protein DSO57_1007837 [Entomophthora muscae]
MTIKSNYVGEDLEVHAPHQKGTVYSLDALCSGRTVVLKVFGRFGCPFTRRDAHLLSQQQQQLEGLGAHLVGIGFDEEGLAEFSLQRFWHGEMFLDHDRCMYNFFQLKRTSKLKAIELLMNSKTRSIYSAAKKEFGATRHGDELQTGGVFVINGKGRVIYACPQPNITLASNVEKILEVCRNESLRRIIRPVPRKMYAPVCHLLPVEISASATLRHYFSDSSIASNETFSSLTCYRFMQLNQEEEAN